MHRPPARTPNDSFVTTSLGRGGLSTRTVLILVTLGGLLLATIGATVFVLRGGLDPATTTTSAFVPGKPAPTAIPTATRPPPPTLGPATPPPGFTARGPADAQSITFGPDRAYECGITNQRVFFAASSDAGSHWTTYPVTTQDGLCSRIAVNPLDAQQIALIVNPCPNQCKIAPAQGTTVYLSLSGGATWRSLALPDASSTVSGMLTWEGGALWIGCFGTHLLAKAVPNAGVQWANFGKMNISSMYLYGVYFSHRALFAFFRQSTGATILTLRTDDQGATWRSVSFHDSGGDGVELTGEAPDGSDLLGAGVEGRLETSVDEGKTWNIPPAHDGFQVSLGTQTPDGTLFIVVDPGGGAQVIALAPHATSWHVVLEKNVGEQREILVSWNAAGHPTAIWVGSNVGFFRHTLQG